MMSVGESSSLGPRFRQSSRDLHYRRQRLIIPATYSTASLLSDRQVRRLRNVKPVFVQETTPHAWMTERAGARRHPSRSTSLGRISLRLEA